MVKEFENRKEYSCSSAWPTVGDEEDSYRIFGGCYLGMQPLSIYQKIKSKLFTKYILRKNIPKEEIFLCGIVGYIGKSNKATEVLLSGLKNLEYRGYDSAGIAYIEDGELKITKAVGPIANLESKTDFSSQSSMGIGHTRWATHGQPSIINSHPHHIGKMTIIHNGIIENYIELKEWLKGVGYIFNSETDTEVACALLDYLYEDQKDMTIAIRQFEEKAKGAYAIVAICQDDLEELYVIKNMSPMIIGIGEGENYVASDVPAILKYTNRYIALEDMDYALISKDEIKLFDGTGKAKNVEVKTYMESAGAIDKNGYEHFMLKEIHEEPEIAKYLIKNYFENDGINYLPDITQYRQVSIVACGSAYHAGLVGKYFIEKNIGIPVSVEIASEFRYKKLFLDKNSLVIAISQSGETADTLAAIKIAKKNGSHTLGIVNVKESSIAREVDDVIYTEAGSEIAVATTKAYFAQSLILAFLSLRNKKYSRDIYQKIPFIIEELLERENVYNGIAERFKNCEHVFFLGRQVDYAICMEGSLKLKEISYIHSEAYPAGELKHGTISLIENDTPVFALISDETIAEKTISNIKEVKARGAYVILLINEELNLDGDFYDQKIVVPSCKIDELNSLLSIIPLQIIAYKIALLRECSIDKPRNLAKSVTVE